MSEKEKELEKRIEVLEQIIVNLPQKDILTGQIELYNLNSKKIEGLRQKISDYQKFKEDTANIIETHLKELEEHGSKIEEIRQRVNGELNQLKGFMCYNSGKIEENQKGMKEFETRMKYLDLHLGKVMKEHIEMNIAVKHEVEAYISSILPEIVQLKKDYEFTDEELAIGQIQYRAGVNDTKRELIDKIIDDLEHLFEL